MAFDPLQRVDFNELHAALRLADPEVEVSMGKMWLYICHGARVTTDKYEVHSTIASAYGLKFEPMSKETGWAIRINKRHFIHNTLPRHRQNGHVASIKERIRLTDAMVFYKKFAAKPPQHAHDRHYSRWVHARSVLKTYGVI